jgi:hypothetical protein
MANSRRRRQRNGQRGGQPPPGGQSAPGGLRRLAARPVTWVAATLVTAVTGITVAVLTSIPSQIVDERKLGDSVRGGDDIAVTVDHVNDDGFFSMAFPSRWDLAPEDPVRSAVDTDSATALVAKERDAGAYPVPYLRIRLILEGRRNQQIQITDLAVTDLQFAPAFRGTLVALSQEGATDNQQVAFDLDDAIPRAMDAGAGGDGRAKTYFQSRSISLADREQVVLLAQINPRRDTSATFNLSLRYTIGGESRSVTIDDGSRPFRVTAPSCARHGGTSVDYDRAYTMVETDQGFGLRLAGNSHSVVSPNLNCD